MLDNLAKIIEAVLLTAGEPVSMARLQQLLEEDQPISSQDLQQILQAIADDYQNRGVELVEVASGYRFQAKNEFAPWLQKLQARKTARYSRAFLETLALVVYRQPITRGEIEEVRGVAVSTQIMKSLQDLEWIKIVGQRDVPGKPSLYATTQKFLDDFNLRSFSELPVLQEPRNLDQLELQLSERLRIEANEFREEQLELVEETAA